MGKKKHGYQPEVVEPGTVERLWASRNVRIITGALTLAVFAAIAILVVTLLGGGDLSKADTRLAAPTSIGPAPEIERSAAADALDGKTWDDMSVDERTLVETEVRRIFDNSSFRASSQLVVANDIERREGKTVLSRLFLPAEAAGGPELVQRILFYCETADGTLQSHRYLLSASGNRYEVFGANQYPRSWNTIMSDIDWSDVKDAGWREIDGRRAHGFDVSFTFTGAPGLAPGEDPGPGSRALYWFDVENARLLERTKLLEDNKTAQEQSTYHLDYRQRSPIILPDDVEKPACVQDILARIQG